MGGTRMRSGSGIEDDAGSWDGIGGLYTREFLVVEEQGRAGALEDEPRQESLSSGRRVWVRSLERGTAMIRCAESCTLVDRVALILTMARLVRGQDADVELRIP